MRIALVSGEYPPQPGGIGDYTQQLGTALAARGHSISVFTIADGHFQIIGLRQPPTPAQVTVCQSLSGWGWASWSAVQAAIATTHPDVLHIQYQTGAYGMHPAINLLPWRLRNMPKPPRIAVTAHDLLLPYLFPKAGAVRRWVTARLLADADAVVLTNNDDLAQAATMTCQPPTLIPIGSNIAVAPPPGYNRATWRTQLGVPGDMMLVAFFGLMSHTKGLETLLDALALLPETTRLLIIGGAATTAQDRAYAETFARTIAAKGLQARIIITGHCSAAEVSAHLLAADVAALPFTDGASFRRGSLLAALAHGVPTVTTQPARPLPRLGDGEHVLLVAPGDATALAHTLTRLIHDPQLQERLRRAGPALVQQFSWEAIAMQHEQLYVQLCTHT